MVTDRKGAGDDVVTSTVQGNTVAHPTRTGQTVSSEKGHKSASRHADARIAGTPREQPGGGVHDGEMGECLGYKVGGVIPAGGNDDDLEWIVTGLVDD